MVNVWRCNICGETYIGNEKPTQCPFCGAHDKHIFLAKEKDVNFDVELSEGDRALVEKALEIEISNTGFYLCAAKKATDIEGKAMFKRLGKVEYEHAEIWGKVLKKDIPSREAAAECPGEYKEELQESHDREERAVKVYKEAAEKAENERVKELFTAIIEVEEDHLKLSEERL
jgi:rubrerythrin